jgi:hypothetical protein
MRGSLREKSPGVWEIRVALGCDPLTGSYRTVRRTIHGGKRKAQEEIARIVSSAANGMFQGTRANVCYLTEHWLEHLDRLGRSPKTLEGYRRPASGSSISHTARRKYGPARITIADQGLAAETDLRSDTLVSVSHMERKPVNGVEALESIDPADRVWLEERLVEYEALLLYLHDR